MKKPISFTLLAAGIGCFASAKYIDYQVQIGEAKVKQAEKKLHSFGSFFSIIPIIPLGKTFTGSAQKQLDQAEKKLAAYAKLSSELYHISIPVFLIGLVIFTYSLKKKR